MEITTSSSSSKVKADQKSKQDESLSNLTPRKRQDFQKTKIGTIDSEELLFDPYANCVNAQNLIRAKTGLAYSLNCVKHKCEWDENYPECPQRFTAILDRIKELNLDKHCEIINVDNCNRNIYENVISKHTEELYKKLKCISTLPSNDQREKEASNYDAVYFNEFTFDTACESLKMVLNAVEQVAKGNLQNAMALSRPPGHHAMKNEYCGYCYFNNVAIAAEMCLKENLAKRILIVDYDVHHGQGTQQMFYDKNEVLYFSIHRYEFGTFWPNLLESNFNFIGKDDGFGYNINVPLNEVGLKDEDYLAIIFNILLPVAYEYNPDLIIISAGYDASIGCPEGKMNVTPGFYAHLVTLLSGLAHGKIVVCLEGGYFLPSLAEGAAMTLKALLGFPCPILDPIKAVHPTVINSINDVKNVLLKKWNCFKICRTIENVDDNDKTAHKTIVKFFGEPPQPPHETRNCYPVVPEIDQLYYTKFIECLKIRYNTKPLPVCYVYEEIMLQHKKNNGTQPPERPERLSTIVETFKKFGIDKTCVQLPVQLRDYSKYNKHSKDYLNKVSTLNLEGAGDLYFNECTNAAIETAVCGLLTIIDDIMRNNSSSGLALIRPPGHHADFANASGFCFVNNIIVGANYLQENYNLERILIVDFDIHHGNGTQNMCYDSKNIMYISVHRFDEGKFFPFNLDGNFTNDGYGCGQGYNVNIPLNTDKMGDSEYIAIFHNIILPLAYSYNPEFVLISAGFDAGINDPLGGYAVSPEVFGHFIQMLKPLANGKLILCLEGGYNVTTLGYSMTMCAKALLGDPIPMPPSNLFTKISHNAQMIINNVCEHFKQYWPVLSINKALALEPYLLKSSGLNKSILMKLDTRKAADLNYINDTLNNL